MVIPMKLRHTNSRKIFPNIASILIYVLCTKTENKVCLNFYQNKNKKVTTDLAFTISNLPECSLLIKVNKISKLTRSRKNFRKNCFY